MASGELPYIVLLYGGDLERNHLLSRPGSSTGLRGMLRRSDGGIVRRRRSSIALSGDRLPSRMTRMGRILKRKSDTGALRRAVTEPGGRPDMEAAMAALMGATELEDLGSGGGGLPDSDGEVSWQLEPGYTFGEAGRGIRAINARAEREAGKAASTVMKVAELSSVAAPGFDKVTVQPRLRYSFLVLVRGGVLVQVEDTHRLENTSEGDRGADPTLELAFAVRLPDGPQRPGDAGEGAPREASADQGNESSGDADADADGGETGLRLELDFEHVASSEILGEQDSLSMHGAFGMEGRYFNPRVKRSEHFLEPWR